MEKFCQQQGIKHVFSSPYHPQANGQAEAFNKSIVKILKRTTVKNKRDWHLTVARSSLGLQDHSQNRNWVHALFLGVWDRSGTTFGSAVAIIKGSNAGGIDHGSTR